MVKLLLASLILSCDPDTPDRPRTWEGRYPGECSDGADNDGDGLYDCNDSDCAGAPDCQEPTDDTGRDTAPPPDSDPDDTEDSKPPEDSDTSDPPGDTGPDTDDPTSMVAKLDPYVAAAVRIEPSPLVAGSDVTITYEGSLVGSAKQLTVYYGWDDTSWGNSEKMTATHAGFEITFEVPKENIALHLTFSDSDTGETDDRGGLDYHASVFFPYIGPYLSWSTTAQPGDGIVIGWETTVPCLGVLEWGLDAKLGSWETGSHDGTVHQVELTGLTPGDTVHYRVYDSLENVSDIYTYEVPDTTAAFEFAALSDLQPWDADGRLPDTVSELLANHPDARFAYLPGDLVGWDDPLSWWLFFHLAKDLWSTMPAVPVPGNHDNYGSGTLLEGFQRYWDLPWPSPSQPWCSIDYGPVHVISLYSEEPSTMEAGTDQYVWLQSDLAGCWSGATRTCDWVFAANHVPPYNVGMRHFYEQYDVREITQLFQGEVDWHISGHEHVYMRFLPLHYEAQLADSDSYGLGSDDGVGYLILPTSGSTTGYSAIDPKLKDASVRELLAYPELADDTTDIPAELGFVIIAIDGTDLTLTAYGTGENSAAEAAEVLETMTYSK